MLRTTSKYYFNVHFLGDKEVLAFETKITYDRVILDNKPDDRIADIAIPCDISFKMSENHTYYNENLFRTIELTRVS